MNNNVTVEMTIDNLVIAYQNNEVHKTNWEIPYPVNDDVKVPIFVDGLYHKAEIINTDFYFTPDRNGLGITLTYKIMTNSGLRIIEQEFSDINYPKSRCYKLCHELEITSYGLAKIRPYELLGKYCYIKIDSKYDSSQAIHVPIVSDVKNIKSNVINPII